ncbi:endonuclease domain-containing protein [Candidatus Gracilibacteria bacterium]|nr:endonuclease domain-containing protein [Candidatus Gracilibacteria bacterium]
MQDKYISYDTRLKTRARELRKNQTPAENYIWQKILRNKQFFGYKFTRQKMLGFFIADFYCSELKLVIEIDGDTHFSDEAIVYDEERTLELNKLGLQVIRYTNKEILENIEGVYENLKNKLHNLQKS